MRKWVLQGLKPPVLAARGIPIINKYRCHIRTETDMKTTHLKTAIEGCTRKIGG